MRMRRLQIVYVLGVLLVALFVSFKFFWVQPADFERYQKMVKKKALASSLQSSYTPTEQHRSKVRKEIWLTQEDRSRLHYQIESRESLLTLTPINNTFEVVEALKGVSCWMQEKLTETGQQSRFFVAEEGLYRYHTSQLIAKEATLSLYRLPGKDLPLTPPSVEDSYLRGIAQNISLTFGGKIPEFKAHSFKALIKEQKR